MLRFLARNRMLNWRYGLLAWRYLWRRLLTPSGRRWRTDGFVFFGRGLEIEIGARGRVDFGRFLWIGDRTKIRCHEGLVEIGRSRCWDRNARSPPTSTSGSASSA